MFAKGTGELPSKEGIPDKNADARSPHKLFGNGAASGRCLRSRQSFSTLIPPKTLGEWTPTERLAEAKDRLFGARDQPVPCSSRIPRSTGE